jgi:hypothetical protein
MTDLLDPPAPPPAVDVAVDAPPAEPAVRSATGALLVLAALLLGAGLIHATMAPPHLGESAVEGAGFVVAAWLQVLLAAAVLVRPRRWVLGAVVAVNAVLLVAWVVSRTAGLPVGAHPGHAATVSFVDGACAALEVAAVLLAGVLLLGTPVRLLRGGGAALASLAAVVVATAAVASPSARDHASASHGEHAHGDMAAAAPHGHDGAAGAAGEADDAGFAALSNGHQHERGQDEPLSDEERVTLAGQLAATAALVEQFPTIAHAEAAGWRRAGPFSPGLGTHYRGPDFGLNPDGDMDPEDLSSPLLVFDGLGPDAPLAGFMYTAYGTESEPAGFAGPNDHWHYHESVCVVVGPGGAIDTPFGADLEGVTEEMCTDVGGSWIDNTGYMVHVWNVPGYESPDGMFTELNRKITCPDGGYDRIDIEDVGTRDSVCLNP